MTARRAELLSGAVLAALGALSLIEAGRLIEEASKDPSYVPQLRRS